MHTTSRCCSPLMSMASRLSIEHGRAGNVTSNCIFIHHMEHESNSEVDNRSVSHKYKFYKIRLP